MRYIATSVKRVLNRKRKSTVEVGRNRACYNRNTRSSGVFMRAEEGERAEKVPSKFQEHFLKISIFTVLYTYLYRFPKSCFLIARELGDLRFHQFLRSGLKISNNSTTLLLDVSASSTKKKIKNF